MGERELERADVVAFLRAEEQKFAAAAEAPGMPDEAHERCSLRASTLRTAAAYIERCDHVRAVERTPEVGTSYTRAQFAAAVDEAHGALHEADEAEDTDTLLRRVARAHEALHNVGAGQERVACATMDPEAQAIHADLRALRDRQIPCGHTVADLIGGTERGPDGRERPSITKCGACLAIRQPEIIAARQAKETATAAERTPEVVLRAMLRAYEAATFDACLAYFQADRDTPEERAHHERARLLHRQCDVVRREAAGVAAGYPDPVDFATSGETSDCLMADYEARLRGDRPLDAPPMEVP